MATSKSTVLIDEAEALLAAIRGGIIVHVQDGVHPNHLKAPLDLARMLNRLAVEIAEEQIRTSADALEAWIMMLAAESDPISHTRTRSLLDQISELEIALIAHKAACIGVNEDVGELLDETFDILELSKSAPEPDPTNDDNSADVFEIDAEMLEVFGEEAEGLLQHIQSNLEILAKRPNDRDALWEIKKTAHTFKGASGVVGLKTASELAHRIEDLLEQLSEKNASPDPEILQLLLTSANYLDSLANDEHPTEIEKKLPGLYSQFDNKLSRISEPQKSPPPVVVPQNHAALYPDRDTAIVSPPTRKGPIVRVSLDRIDDLVRHVRDLAISRSTFEHRLHELHQQLEEAHNNSLRLQGASNNIEIFRNPSADPLSTIAFDKAAYELSETARDASLINTALEIVRNGLEELYEGQCELIGSMQERLLRLRNVEFGTIKNRLMRTVRVTCDEEGKHADINIENATLEVDTQLVDSLIEPLLHLLKNAVVHGIEDPETRRMLGKPESGKITIRVSNKGVYLVMSITDDGRGIAFRPLLDKALSSNLIDRTEAERLTPDQVRELIFLPGLTTADKLNLNAGRGVGMSIVRESIAALGGSVTIETWPQRGTTFSIRVPRPFADTAPLRYDENLQLSGSMPGVIKVLIVDDSPSVRLMTSKIVESAGWYYETAKNGIDAIEKLHEMSVKADVILTDIEMPKMGGYELLAALRDEESLRDIPVVFISSRNGVAERQRALSAGVSEYITKPYDKERLVEVVEGLARRSELVGTR